MPPLWQARCESLAVEAFRTFLDSSAQEMLVPGDLAALGAVAAGVGEQLHGGCQLLLLRAGLDTLESEVVLGCRGAARRLHRAEVLRGLRGSRLAVCAGRARTVAVVRQDGRVHAAAEPTAELEAWSPIGAGTACSSDAPARITSLGMSPWTLLAVDENGKVFYAERAEAEKNQRAFVWVPVQAFKGITARAAFSRFGQMFVVTRDGRLFGWGFASGDFTPARACSIGLPAGPQDVPEPVEITAAPGADRFGFGKLPVRTLACGVAHVAILTECGQAFAVGQGQAGQLGQGGFDDAVVPVRMRVPEGVRIRCAAGGLSHTLLVSTAGEVFGCGSATSGELPVRHMSPGALPPELVAHGYREWAFEPIPRRLDLLPPIGKFFAVGVACGLSTSFFLGEDGSVFFTGTVLSDPTPFGRPRAQEAKMPHRLRNLPRVREVSVSLNVPLKLPGLPFATIPEVTEGHPGEVALFLAEDSPAPSPCRVLAWGAPGGAAPRALPGRC